MRSFAVVLAMAAFGSACGGGAKDEAKKVLAATVQNAIKEEQLATVTLAPEAEKRLGVEFAVVEKKTVPRSRSVSGELMTPPGQSNIVTAPTSGTVLPSGPSIQTPGTMIRRGAVVLRLMALPPGGDLAGPEIRLEAARRRMARVEQLLKDGAASRRSLEEAQAELGLAEAAARGTRPMTGRAEDSIPVTSPQDGVLRAVHVGAGQTVSGGTPLFQVDSLGTLWVRVPTYVGDLRDVIQRAPARITTLSADPTTAPLLAAPVSGPPSANADAATSDLYYVLENGRGNLKAGEKVAVILALKSSEESLVVPWSAILHDLNGGTWVYENVSPHVYARRRVEVRHVMDGLAILARGPAVGAKIVSVGAAEIFGTEFGTGK